MRVGGGGTPFSITHVRSPVRGEVEIRRSRNVQMLSGQGSVDVVK